MNCDRIAPVYALLETIAFGSKLQTHRLAFLDAAAGRKRALILGDGDGRFTHALASRFPALQIDSLDISTGMLREARRRLKSALSVRFIRADALTYSFKGAPYDLVFTHFFLDCFSTDVVEDVVRRLSASLTEDAIWVISEFQEQPSGWKKIFTGLWLWAMYRFFRFATGLTTQKLPAYSNAFEQAGFRLARCKRSMASLITSEWWQRQ